MVKIKGILVFLVSCSILYSSCATICGGSKYNANIVVNQKPNAKIFYKGHEVGTGKARVLVKRKEANRFEFSVKEESCDEEKYRFKSRTFRGWAMIGSIITWTVSVNGVPLFPVGLVIDLSNGSLWKPNVYEKNVEKQDFKNYRYTVDYKKSCVAENKVVLKPGSTKTDIVYLRNGKVIKGTIIERAADKSIQIRITDGDVVLYPSEEIEKIEQVITEKN
ncbi:MAG: hypothetical protein V4561_12880 [Bacteroidota bacterium]